MQIISPDLCCFDRRRYATDLQYRQEIDKENFGERRERLNLLFHPERVEP